MISDGFKYLYIEGSATSSGANFRKLNSDEIFHRSVEEIKELCSLGKWPNAPLVDVENSRELERALEDIKRAQNFSSHPSPQSTGHG
ncbi:MAG: hypothetical protein WBK55_03485 [Alphaproteobacteria bacterium]